MRPTRPPATTTRPGITRPHPDRHAPPRRSRLMTEKPTIALPRPAVVVALSPFGDRITKALAQRLERRHGRLPDSCRLVLSTTEPAVRLAPALTEVLNLRNAP